MTSAPGTSQDPVERRTREIGLAMFADANHAAHGRFSTGFDERLMAWSMRDEQLKVSLFHFVDVLPTLTSHDEILRHLQEYLGSPESALPAFGQLGLHLAGTTGLTSRALAAAIRQQVIGMARRFIAGSTIREASRAARRLRANNMACTLDILGEVTLSEQEAETYQQQYLALLRGMAPQAARWREQPHLDRGVEGLLPRVNVSLKLSSLCAHCEPADPEGTATLIKARLRPIFNAAMLTGAFVHIDMEHFLVKDLTLQVFHEIIMEPAYRDWPHVGIVLQAYLRDSEHDAHALIALARERGTPFTVRLVKGAYWDAETVLARQRHWPIPVWTEKFRTDLQFETLSRLLLEQYPHLHTAIASHNIRSIARAIAIAESLRLPPGANEFQALYGMGDSIKAAVLAQGQRLRVYTPYGELIPGMAYLVRRLLENTANDSFLRQGFTEHQSPEALLVNPAIAAAITSARQFTQDEQRFPNVPERNYAQANHRALMREALARVRDRFNQQYPLLINSNEVTTDHEITSSNPAKPAEIIGRVAAAGRREAALAVEAAVRAAPGWRSTPARERIALLRKAADLLEWERDELAALQVYEVGKHWHEADADVCETIDYFRYYAREMERLAAPRRLEPLPGETNEYYYRPKGVALIIAPWNFPMALVTGMLTAALVTGNTAIVKPASQSPICAAKIIDALQRAGLPPGVVNFLPGPSQEIGDYLVQHPDIHLIAFTGSRDVGCRINRLAADVAPGQRHLKKVIAEMGGKNALIVDADADLDEAVAGTVQAAFGYQGQKCSACSRVIVLRPAYDAFLARLVAATRSLQVGPPEEPGNLLGPVIDAAARERILRTVEIGKSEARVALEREHTQRDGGHYVGPVIFTDVPPTATIAREEIFGPVLCVMAARDLDEAFTLANSTDYALTGGIFSRSPVSITRAREAMEAGNFYINRKITGAIVARQPFGGFRLSGVGSKAGGPDYLLQFMDPVTVTQNTLRRGFAPDKCTDTG